jgi:glutathione peroxidase
MMHKSAIMPPELAFEDIDGQSFSLTEYLGHVILLVNTASQCGYTPQYSGLEALWRYYRASGLVVIAIPSHDFGGQEPGTAIEIKDFCQFNYGISFRITAKQKILGPDAHPFFQWVKTHLGAGALPRWNFHKYLLARSGEMIASFATQTRPDDPALIAKIEAALKMPAPRP